MRECRSPEASLWDASPDALSIGRPEWLACQVDVMQPGLPYGNVAVRGPTAREVRETRLRPALSSAGNQ
jgi:hypothetical protein